MPNIAVPAPPDALFKLKFHQVAIYSADPEAAVEFWEAAGFHNWTEDECILRGTEHGRPLLMKEREFFNYDIMPLELCYMQYSTGYFRRGDRRSGDKPFIGHMATYVEDLEAEINRINESLDIRPYRVYDSVEHQNPYLVEKKQKFHKCIYNTMEWLGFDVKLTQRVFPGDPHYPAPLTATERGLLDHGFGHA